LLSGNFSFTAGQSGNPDNFVEIIDGEFNNVPITNLQQPDDNVAVFYHNDKLYYADSVVVRHKPPYLLEVALFHESTGWVRTVRPLRNYPDYNQISYGHVWGLWWTVNLISTFNSEYSAESETITQSMKLLHNPQGDVYDYEYFLGETSISKPYTTESQTVKLWSYSSSLDDNFFTDAYLTPDDNGNFELTATNELNETITITNISENPGTASLGNHNAYASFHIGTSSVGFGGKCYWQESELGSGFYSIQFAPLEFQFLAPIIVGKDIPIVE